MIAAPDSGNRPGEQNSAYGLLRPLLAVGVDQVIAGPLSGAGGKSEHHRAGCSITWSHGDVKESATESIPPWMLPSEREVVQGKGETVR